MHFHTAAGQLAALRRREVSASELLDATIERIGRLDGRLNAIVVRDFEAARRDAAAADRALARGEAAPLLGLPMTVKESFDVAGLPTTWGIAQAPRTPAAADAVAVRRLRAAGAVVLGKTNVPPQLADWQSDNPIHGRTVNPWDAARTPGGSSGGSAAALAAGLVALELGTDIGGSLRVPAHCCGVFAHKPSHGLVPMRGCAPPGVPRLAVAGEVDLAVAGPMARSAADLALALDLLAGPDDDRAAAWTLRLPPPRHRRLRDHRVLVLREHPLLPSGREVAAAIDGFAERLAAAGCRVATQSPLLPDLARIADLQRHLLLAFFGADLPAPAYAGIAQALHALPATEASPQAAELRALASSHRDWIAADRGRIAVRAAWRALFADWDLVVCPVMPLPALPHDDTPMAQRTVEIDGRRLPYAMLGLWAGVATLAGLPATALPLPRGSGGRAGGLPIGVQVVGPFLEDRTPLAFAAQVEEAFGGFEAPPGWD